ncbi:MAG TPA: hypothetical protein VG273_21635 [Bryobacteraceae bacterium]|jgi:hypothetical protein|nr:hypothetical protein [Bryobacteraceae bacterium]
MTWFPQIGAGSIAQYPLQRSRKWRSISNTLESGERILLPDSPAGEIDWYLPYRDLSDAEVLNLTNLFTSSQGCFGAFAFIDPLANLLGWSEDLSRPDWQTGLLQKHGSVDDPAGTLRSWTLSNGTAGTQALSQTLGISGDYSACFSLYVRSSAAGTVTLQRDAHQVSPAVEPAWTRIWISGGGTPGAAQSAFSIVLVAGQSIDVWGLQVEAQVYPSLYMPTTAARGIYEETYFAADEMNVTSDGVGLSSCVIHLTSRV